MGEVLLQSLRLFEMVSSLTCQLDQGMETRVIMRWRERCNPDRQKKQDLYLHGEAVDQA